MGCTRLIKRSNAKFAIALPGEKAGPVTPLFYAYLRPGQAMEIDGPDIRRHVQFPAPFLKGFAVIESLTELDIVVVYTAAGEHGHLETLEIERVPAGCALVYRIWFLCPIQDRGLDSAGWMTKVDYW